MIDRLAELCDRVAELEAENARLQKVVSADTEVIAVATEQIADLAATMERLEGALRLVLDQVLDEVSLCYGAADLEALAMYAVAVKNKIERLEAATAPKEEP